MTDIIARTLAAALVSILAAVLVMLEAVSGAEWQAVMQWLIAAYMTGEIVPPVAKTAHAYIAARKA